MQTSWTANSGGRAARRAPNDRLARGLGWFSIGLGLAELVAPDQLARGIGLAPAARRNLTLRALGVRELAAGVGILSRPRPAGWLWSRVLGDVMDLALLGWALRAKRADRGRLGAAIGAVAGVLVLDALAGRRHLRAKHVGTASITIYRSPEEVARAVEQLRHASDVFFNEDKLTELELCPAPGGRGTEVKAKLRSILAATLVRNDLRRLKQVIETGEVVKSDASIHPGMHAAQPPVKEDLQ